MENCRKKYDTPNPKPRLRKTPDFQLIHSHKCLMVYSHCAELGPRQESRPEPVYDLRIFSRKPSRAPISKDQGA